MLLFSQTKMDPKKLIHIPSPGEETLPILYSDDYMVAINKPNGLLVHKTKIAEERHNFANKMLSNQLGRQVHPVHRIDRATSGLLLFGCNAQAVAALQALFNEGKMVKEYLAIVRGRTLPEGKIDDPLIKHETGVIQEATTTYSTLAQAEVPIAVNKYPTSRYSLVRMLPLTGRTHQLRRHFNHLGHPIVGDTKFGDLRHNRMFEREFGVTILLLHAVRLSFVHPFTGTSVEITAPVPAEFALAAKKLSWESPLERFF